MVAFDDWSARTAAKRSSAGWRQGDRAVYQRQEGHLAWVHVMAKEDEDGQVLVCLEMMRRGRGRSVYPFLAPAARLFASTEEAICGTPTHHPHAGRPLTQRIGNAPLS